MEAKVSLDTGDGMLIDVMEMEMEMRDERRRCRLCEDCVKFDIATSICLI